MRVLVLAATEQSYQAVVGWYRDRGDEETAFQRIRSINDILNPGTKNVRYTLAPGAYAHRQFSAAIRTLRDLDIEVWNGELPGHMGE